MSCERELLDKEEFLCLHCYSDVPRFDSRSYEEQPITQLFWGKSSVIEAQAIYYFTKGEKIQSFLHEIKYNGKSKFAFFLGEKMGELLIQDQLFSTKNSKHLSTEFDAVCYVPSNRKKIKKRGYNQAELLANGISEMLKIPVLHLLCRQKESSSQTQKNVHERHKNLADSFQINSKSKHSDELKNLLLVDDVITTGATLNACASILEKQLNAKVWVLCLAYREV